MSVEGRITELMVKISEVGVDVKHLLARHDETSERIDRMEDRTNKVLDEHGERLRIVEAHRGKMLGVAFVLPVIISLAAIAIGRYV